MNNNNLAILVVEDDDFQRKLVVDMVCSMGVGAVYDAANGQHALNIIRIKRDSPVDIIISDLNMPQMDGLEFLRHLGEERHDVGIILVSELDRKLLTTAGNMVKLYGIKLLGMLEKPFWQTQLGELFSKYSHSGKRWQQPATAEASFTLKEILEGVEAKQFEPYFQPKLDLKTGQLVGAEALVRWIHPQRGVIAPYAFIPLLEESNNIDQLTFLMLEKSAKACYSLHEKGYPISISVNLSLTSLSDPLIADKITEAVRDTGLDPAFMLLEITESAAMTNVAHALENLARLGMYGFSLSIDDYGTGYSSLQQLTRIAFSELKIDGSFVKDLTDSETMCIIVESCIDMARKLKVTSTAEGVETQQDWDILKNIGCDTAQGYFIAKPMDFASFVEFCAELVPA